MFSFSDILQVTSLQGLKDRMPSDMCQLAHLNKGNALVTGGLRESLKIMLRMSQSMLHQSENGVRVGTPCPLVQARRQSTQTQF